MEFEAIIFDLDDTLIDRNHAVTELFKLFHNKYYLNNNLYDEDTMMKDFINLDKKYYGKDEKDKIFKNFILKYPLNQAINLENISHFWNNNFPQCFKPDKKVKQLLDILSRSYKIALITNGTSMRQRQKLVNSNLEKYFEVVIISDEVSVSKPNVEIFQKALNKLKLPPEKCLYVGDHLINDIQGSQQAGLKSCWYNPNDIKNKTDVIPDLVINNLQELYFNK
ncbi:HAD family hydrolase [Mammaliicoccus sciuri]